MRQYHDALRHIMYVGKDRTDRTGVGTRSVFGYQMRFDLSKGFPAVTTKKLAWKSVVSELLWFLEGSTDERRLAEIHYGKDRTELVGKSTIWTANVDNQGKALGYTDGELGPVYGKQWRDFNGFDQVDWLVNEIQTNPDSRRLILSSWNAPEIDKMSLPPCHTLCQFYVQDGKLSCQLYQRSADMFLGVPFNIASYALFAHMIAQKCTLQIGDLVWTGGDSHIYSTHVEVVKEQLQRKPRSLPRLKMPEIKSFDISDIKKLSPTDFVLLDYDPMETLTAPMAV